MWTELQDGSRIPDVTPLDQIPPGELIGMALTRELVAGELADSGQHVAARRHLALAADYRQRAGCA